MNKRIFLVLPALVLLCIGVLVKRLTAEKPKKALPEAIEPATTPGVLSYNDGTTANVTWIESDENAIAVRFTPPVSKDQPWTLNSVRLQTYESPEGVLRIYEDEKGSPGRLITSVSVPKGPSYPNWITIELPNPKPQFAHSSTHLLTNSQTHQFITGDFWVALEYTPQQGYFYLSDRESDHPERMLYKKDGKWLSWEDSDWMIEAQGSSQPPGWACVSIDSPTGFVTPGQEATIIATIQSTFPFPTEGSVTARVTVGGNTLYHETMRIFIPGHGTHQVTFSSFVYAPEPCQEHIITVTASVFGDADPTNDVCTATIPCAIRPPLTIKQDAVMELEQLLMEVSSEPKVSHHVEKALEELNTVFPFFIDPFHVDHDDKPRVFGAEKKVAEEMRHTARKAKKHEIPIFETIIKDARNIALMMVEADSLLAKKALEEAQLDDTLGDPGMEGLEELEKAQEKFAEPDPSMFEMGIEWFQYDQAIVHFMNATILFQQDAAPPKKQDTFNSRGEITVRLGDPVGEEHFITVEGQTTVERFEVSPGIWQTEILSMDLTGEFDVPGFGPTPVTIREGRESINLPSLGQADLNNQTAFFDVFFSVELGGEVNEVLHNEEPMHIVAESVTELPPVGIPYRYVGPPFELRRADGSPSGVFLTEVIHIPISECVLDTETKSGPGIKVEVVAPEEGESTSKENEIIPLIVKATDDDQFIHFCTCFIDGEDVCIEGKAIDIVDAVSYKWSLEEERGRRGKGKLLNTVGPATLYQPPEIEVGESHTATIQVEIEDSRKNDKTAKVIFTIEITREEECKYKRTVSIKKETDAGEIVTPTGDCKECRPQPEEWKAVPVPLRGEAEDTVEVCAGQRVILKASGEDSDKLKLICLGECGADEEEPSLIDEITYSWTAKGGGFPDYGGSAETNSRNTTVIYKAPDQAREDTVTVTIQDSKKQANDVPVEKMIIVKVSKVELTIEGVSEDDEECTGGFVCLNNDDDNNNKREDKKENPVTGEDDLIKITINKEPKEGDVTLKVTAGRDKIKIWEDKEKKKKSPLTYPASELPKELFVEGVKTSKKLRDVELVLESGSCQEEGKVTVVEGDLVVHNGQSGPVIPEDKEEDPGAFTVTNFNDTDSDGNVDTGDSDTNIPGEKDLMKIVIKKPKPNDLTGKITLTVTGQDAVIWKSSDKSAGRETVSAPEYDISTIPADGLERWIEGVTISGAVRDVEIFIEYKDCVLDKAKATFIWAEKTDVKHDQGDALWGDFTDPPQTLFNALLGGFGLIPIPSPDGGVRNGIGIQFIVRPPGIDNQDGVRFDITRQIEGKAWTQTGGANPVEVLSRDFPANDERPNDDAHNADESTQPNVNNRMYVLDGPGISPMGAVADLEVWRFNFREFIRVRLDGTKPSGNVVSGSRGSVKFDWHVRHRWNRGGTGNYIRSDAGETNNNDIAPGHITVGTGP